MTSLSEAIDDMVAFTQLTDHVFYQILLSDNDTLSEVNTSVLLLFVKGALFCPARI